MACIEKLQIQGIRNFGTEEEDRVTIKFCSPLTLILGQNGCGKTTIIEALKYATCGELPGGSDSGSGFVHDPSLTPSGLPEARGQIKLRFRDAGGKQVTVCRTVQVTRRTSNLQFKTLDSTYTVEGGESVSSRCNSIDALMRNALSVSKPILTNVIFCHQEDSDWPLEKGKKMKDKFDQIFGISEYNKCLDDIKQLMKRLQKDADEAQKNSGEYGAYKEEANAKKAKIEEINGKLRANIESLKSINEEMEPLNEQYNELVEKEVTYTSYKSELKTLNDARNLIVQQQREYKKQITEEFRGSREELEVTLENFERRLNEKKNSLDSLNRQLQEVLCNEQEKQTLINKEQLRVGQLQRDEEQNKERIGERTMHLNLLTDELNIQDVADGTNEQALNILERVEEKIKVLEREAQNIQKEQEEKVESLQRQIEESRREKFEVEHEIKSKKSLSQTNKAAISKCKMEIEKVDRSAGILAKLETQLETISKELETLQQSTDVDNLKELVQENVERRNLIEQQLSRIDEEVKELQQLSHVTSELDRTRENIAIREKRIMHLKDSTKDSLQSLLNHVPEMNIQDKLQSFMKTLLDALKEKNEELMRLEKDLSRLEASEKHAKEKLNQQNRQLSLYEDQIAAACQNVDYEEAVNDVTRKLQDMQDRKGTYTSSEYLFQRYLKKLETSDPVCPVCHRGFDSKEETEALIDDLTRRLQTLPAHVSQATTEIETLSSRQAHLLSLRSHYENISRIQNEEIPRIRAEKEKIEKQKVKLLKDKEDVAAKVKDLEEKDMIAKKVQPDIIAIDQNQAELKKLRADETRLTSQLPPTSSSRTFEEALNEQEELKRQLASVRKLVESSQQKISEYNEKRHRLQERKNAIIAQQLEMKDSAQQRKVLVDKLNELQALESKLQAELVDANSRLMPLVAELSQMDKELSNMKAEHKRKTDAKNKQISGYLNRVRDVKSIQAQIQEYERSGGDEKCNQVRENLVRLNIERQSLIDKRQSLQRDIDSTNQLISNQRLMKLNLDCNLNLMKKKEEERDKLQEIKQLEGRTGNISWKEIVEEKGKLDVKLQQLRTRKTHIEGRQCELQETLRQLEKDLRQPKYKNAEQEYRRCMHTLAVRNMAISDLKHYRAAMDWSMLHFHKERMKIINTLIRDYWRTTYNGSDIDSIEIKMEASESASEKRRSYNYRVVQVKDGIEIDMPGRCSAGQKVLACLIIRIALAETFCKDCGILALDEPTTNLDKENINGLCSTLENIVNSRRSQKNFQLLVITHDEDFIDRLKENERVDYYIRVYRDFHTTKSRVEFIPVQ